MKWLSVYRVLLSIPVGNKHKQNISLLMNLKLFLCFFALHWRLDDELASCELATGTALFTDDQSSQKSLRQWCVRISSWDESPWCLLTALIPLARKANQECNFTPNTCFRARSIWPKWGRGKKRLKITIREGMAERQAGPRWKRARTAVDRHWASAIQQPQMGKEALLICLVFLTE